MSTFSSKQHEGRHAMTLTTALRAPYRSRTLVRANAGRVSETCLRQAILSSLGVLLMLCAARFAADCVRAQATPEGAVALVLGVVLALWLVVEAFGGAHRDGTPPRGTRRNRSARPRSILQEDARVG
jgi:hypothetical protein